jgi:hypothetical protein
MAGLALAMTGFLITVHKHSRLTLRLQEPRLRAGTATCVFQHTTKSLYHKVAGYCSGAGPRVDATSFAKKLTAEALPYAPLPLT